MRLSKALGDEKRLRILRVLSEGEKTLMELAEMFGVAKTTMHHHMIVLRSAGLVSVGVGQKRYRLRTETVPDVGALLSGYLGENRAAWSAYDACALLAAGRRHPDTLLVDQGTSDKFLRDQLKPELLEEACRKAGQSLELRMHAGHLSGGSCAM